MTGPCLLCGLGLVLGSALVTASPLRAEDRALVIGIANYQNLGAAQQLHGPLNDVRLIEGLLVDTLDFRPEQILTLTDAEAGKREVVEAINRWLIEGSGPGDRLFMYFSGHGVQVEDDSGDEADGSDEALVMADVDLENDHYTNLLTDDEIALLFASVSDAELTLVFDSCHSGTLTRSGAAPARPEGARYLAGGALPSDGQRELTLRPALQDDIAVGGDSFSLGAVFSAAAPAQVAYDDMSLPEEDRTGVFTAAFVDGLQGGQGDLNGNGHISYAELLTFLRQRSTDYCDQLAGCLALTPTLELSQGAMAADMRPRFNTAPSAGPVNSFNFTPQPQRFNTSATAIPEVATVATAPTSSDHAAQPSPPETALVDWLGQLPSAAVQVATAPNRLVAGEAFRIEVRSDMSGQLVVYDVTFDGQVVQIYPNAFAHKDARVGQGRLLTMPDADYGFAFLAEPPGGTIIALVVEEAVDLSTLAPQALGLSGSQQADQLVARISSAMADYVVTTMGDQVLTRQASWAYGALPYRVTPAEADP